MRNSRENMTINFNKPSIVGYEIKYIRDAVARGQLSGDGHYTKLCSELIEKKTGSKKALITHSCTGALEMAAILCDLKPGDEVIMPSYTFVSTANAVVLRGAIPVFVDIDPKTLNVDSSRIEAAVNRRTKAIFVVHYAGFICDMDSIQEIAKKHGLLLVEDAAQALGSSYKGRPAGSFGDLAAFSFHETKNIISGEGGALCINNEDLISRAEIIREKGTNRTQFFNGQVDKYTWVDIGSSYLPGELIAAFLYGQLECMDNIRKRRISIFERYEEEFMHISDERLKALPKSLDVNEGNGHMFYLMLNSLQSRTEFIDHMRMSNITTPFHYIPLHSAPAGLKYAKVVGDMTNTNKVSERLVRLPMYSDLGNDIEQVIASTLEFFS